MKTPRMCGPLALVDSVKQKGGSNLFLITQIVKRCLFGGFELQVLDGFFDIIHFESPAAA